MGTRAEVALARNVKDWIKGFQEFARPFDTAPLYTEWTGLWQVATAVGRQVGTKLRGQLTTPNLFLLLVGGPGAGKSQAVIAARKVILPATGITTIPASVTRAGLLDYMRDNFHQRTTPTGDQIMSNECIALSEEMQGILPEHDIGHLTLYNELYSPANVYEAITRTHGLLHLEAPYCSIITGAQPAFLASQLPEQAWGMGFMSRSILVFDQPRIRTSAFEFEDVDHALQSKLIMDLKQIKQLHGYMHWEDEAKHLYKVWWIDNMGEPVPSAKRLAMGYNARRALHFFKIAMAMSLSRTNDLRVTVEDAARAIELLTRTEANMRHVFTEMASTGFMNAMADVLDAVKVRCADGGKMPEADLIHMLMQRVPSHQVKPLIENMLSGDLLRLAKGSMEGQGFRSFTLGGKVAAL